MGKRMQQRASHFFFFLLKLLFYRSRDVSARGFTCGGEVMHALKDCLYFGVKARAKEEIYHFVVGMRIYNNSISMNSFFLLFEGNEMKCNSATVSLFICIDIGLKMYFGFLVKF